MADTSTSVDARMLKRNLLQNHLLIWLDHHIDDMNLDCSHQIAQLREIMNEVYTFQQMDECLDFLTDIDEQYVYMIIAADLGRRLIPCVHSIEWLDRIYIIDNDETRHSHHLWTTAWPKVRGVFRNTTLVCEDLQVAVKQCNQDSVPISCFNLNGDIDKMNWSLLEPSFMHIQLMISTFLTMKSDDGSLADLVNYCRTTVPLSSCVLDSIDEFQRDYTPSKVIWWYTRKCVAYRMLSQALRLVQVDAIVHMRFFICDLYRQIQKLHKEQHKRCFDQPFTVYRAQRLRKIDFDKLKSNQGGFLSFQNFFSASKTKDMPLLLLESNVETESGLYGVLFTITVDPQMKSTLFADIHEINDIEDEAGILFSIQTVFRIENIVNIDRQARIFEVFLSLTHDDDQRLRAIQTTIEREIMGLTCIRRIADLFIRMEQPDILETLYGNILKQTSEHDEERIECHYYLAFVKNIQGNRKQATYHLRRALSLAQKYLSQNNPKLAAVYSSIAVSYERMGEYASSLFFYEKAVDLQQQLIPENPSDRAGFYNSIGLAYETMGKDSKALTFYEKAIDLQQKRLPFNHPYLAVCFSNVGLMYENLRNKSKASLFHEKANRIHQMVVGANYDQLGLFYHNMATIYKNLGRYPKALSLLRKVMSFQQRKFSSNYVQSVNLYNDIAFVHYKLGEYSQALDFYNTVLDMQQGSRQSKHGDGASTYANMAMVYHQIGEYSTALSLYQRALYGQLKMIPRDHLQLALLYSSIASTYCYMGETCKAKSFCDKALKILLNNSTSMDPLLAISYNHIGLMHQHLGDFRQSFTFCEKALHIRQTTLHTNHPDLAASYLILGTLEYQSNRYAEAMHFLQKSLDIAQLCLPSEHADIRKTLQWIETIRNAMKG